MKNSFVRGDRVVVNAEKIRCDMHPNYGSEKKTRRIEISEKQENVLGEVYARSRNRISEIYFVEVDGHCLPFYAEELESAVVT